MDATTGAPSFDLGLGDIQAPQTTLDEIFAYIEEADKPCIIAIDEFQQIGAYAEKNVEALLRTNIQKCHRAQFIFSGSKRHLMSNMFNSPSKPFYQSVITMGLQPITLDTYATFATALFEERDRHIAKEGVALNVTSAKFIKKYNLNSASSVQAAVKLLLKNDLLTQKDNGYRVYDFFLAEWLSSVY